MVRKWTTRRKDEPNNQLRSTFHYYGIGGRRGVRRVLSLRLRAVGALMRDPPARDCDSRCEDFKLTARETVWRRGCVDGQVESTGVPGLDIPPTGQRLVRVISDSADIASGNCNGHTMSQRTLALQREPTVSGRYHDDGNSCNLVQI